MGTQGLRAALAGVANKLGRKAAPVKAKGLEPTPEQMSRGNFVRVPGLVERGQVHSTAYRREPLFETLAKGKTGITEEGLRALRFYRNAYEEAARSEVRSCLNVVPRGNGGSSPSEALFWAGSRVGLCEAALFDHLETMRAVALHDLSFSDVAIARFGGRKQSWIDMEEESGRAEAKARGRKPARFVEKIVPKSGRHREIVKQEFLAGLDLLTAAVRPHVRTGD